VNAETTPKSPYYVAITKRQSWPYCVPITQGNSSWLTHSERTAELASRRGGRLLRLLWSARKFGALWANSSRCSRNDERAMPLSPALPPRSEPRSNRWSPKSRVRFSVSLPSSPCAWRHDRAWTLRSRCGFLASRSRRTIWRVPYTRWQRLPPWLACSAQVYDVHAIL